MELYLITKHDQYYPSGGPHDWQELFTDEGKAGQAFDELKLSEWEYAYLIHITTEGWSIVNNKGFN